MRRTMKTTPVSTIKPGSPTDLPGLVDAFEKDVEALVALYPAQGQNRDYYRELLATARRGTITHTFASKGNFTYLPVMSTVLVMTEPNGEFPDQYTVYAPSVRGPLILSNVPREWVA